VTRRLRTAVVGVGHLGRIHARILKEHPLSELVCVADSDLERARKLAEELGVRAVPDARDLPKDLDAATVVVPTTAHAQVAVPLLERGVPCLVEKPLASSVAEADLLLAAAERGGVQLAVGHVERFQPGVRKLRQLGLEPRFIECHRLSQFGFRALDVGVVHDLMIHDLDLVLAFVPSEVESLDAVGGVVLSSSVDLASVRIVFRNGVRANVTASRVSLTPMRRFRMFSSRGYVSLDFTANAGTFVRKGPNFERGLADARRLSAAGGSHGGATSAALGVGLLDVVQLELGTEERPLQAELDSFLRAVVEDRAPEVTGMEGRRALELADRIVSEIRAQAW
jgi:predicted dehydrogenase